MLETKRQTRETARVRIREYHPEDFDRLWRLDQECFPSGMAYSRFELMRYIREPRSFTLVAAAGNEITGFVIAECRGGMRGRKSARKVGHIITIDVSPSLRRGGVGTHLMQAAETRLREGGCEVVYLETAVNNTAARAFYQRLGYSMLNVIPRYYDGALDAWMMGKKLGPRPRS